MNSGFLKFIHGPMNSGKSLQLLIKAHDFEKNNIPILVLKPNIDTRDGENIIHSRLGIERKCQGIDKKDNLFNICLKHRYCKFILIDEAQFLTPLQVDQLAKIVDTIGLNVICYGLRTDFKSKLFPASKRLFEIADTIEEIKAYCKCGNKAIINARFDVNGKMITDGDQVMIGGDETYTAICRECFFNYLNKEEKTVMDNETSN